MSTIAGPRVTPDDLLAMPDEKLYELVNGELVEKPMGFREIAIANSISRLVSDYALPRRLGTSYVEATIQCFADEPGKVRRPDVMYLSRGRQPAEPLPEGHCRVAPDLAVEVISPHDNYYEVEGKVDEYLSAGVRLVWVVEPPSQTVRVHRADGSVADIRASGDITGEDVIPGFRCRVASFFADALAEPQS
jgi:Uma2 family endonuclease